MHLVQFCIFVSNDFGKILSLVTKTQCILSWQISQVFTTHYVFKVITHVSKKGLVIIIVITSEIKCFAVNRMRQLDLKVETQKFDHIYKCKINFVTSNFLKYFSSKEYPFSNVLVD